MEKMTMGKKNEEKRKKGRGKKGKKRKRGKEEKKKKRKGGKKDPDCDMKIPIRNTGLKD